MKFQLISMDKHTSLQCIMKTYHMSINEIAYTVLLLCRFILVSWMFTCWKLMDCWILTHLVRPGSFWPK